MTRRVPPRSHLPSNYLLDDNLPPTVLAIFERAYLEDPELTYNDLVAAGYDATASALRTDYQTGRLAQNVRAAP